MERALVAFGSNLGDRESNLRSALLMIRQHPRVALLDASPVYETDPEGGPPQGPYLNACALFLSTLEVEPFFDLLQHVEGALGRKRDVIDGPRSIDLDLLLHGDQTVSSARLTVPHPRFLTRAFVLKPASDIASFLVHPLSRLPIGDHLRAFGPLRGVRFFRAPGAWAVREMPHDHS